MESTRDSEILLHTADLKVGYAQKSGPDNILLEQLNLDVSAGELITLIGPNGCGKSTLIRTLSGLIPKLHGVVDIKGCRDTTLTHIEKSQLMGIVLTDPVYERNMTIYDLVALGRFQHTNWLGRLQNTDKTSIHEAIEQVGLDKMVHKKLNEISDGERQRAMIAKVLAQDVDLVILDEPTAHLDLPNRMEMLLLLRQISHESGKGILLSTHELGLALQVSDIVWMVSRGQKLSQAIPEDLILSGELDKTFGNEQIGFHPFSASFELIPNKPIGAFVVGDGLVTACVIRMLKRLRIAMAQDETAGTINIRVDEQNQLINVDAGSQHQFTTMIELQDFLTSLLND